MKDKSLLIKAGSLQKRAQVLIDGGFNGDAIARLVQSMDKVIAYLESEKE